MGKILRNKDLQDLSVRLRWGVKFLAADDLVDGPRTVPLCALRILSQGWMSHEDGDFLCRAVENFRADSSEMPSSAEPEGRRR